MTEETPSDPLQVFPQRTDETAKYPQLVLANHLSKLNGVEENAQSYTQDSEEALEESRQALDHLTNLAIDAPHPTEEVVIGTLDFVQPESTSPLSPLQVLEDESSLLYKNGGQIQPSVPYVSQQFQASSQRPPTPIEDTLELSKFHAQLETLIETNRRIMETLLHQLSVQSAMLQQMIRAATTFTEVAEIAEMSTTSDAFK